MGDGEDWRLESMVTITHRTELAELSEWKENRPATHPANQVLFTEIRFPCVSQRTHAEADTSNINQLFERFLSNSWNSCRTVRQAEVRPL